MLCSSLEVADEGMGRRQNKKTSHGALEEGWDASPCTCFPLACPMEQKDARGNPEEAPAMLNCSSNGDQYLDLNKKSAKRPNFEAVGRKCLQVN